MIAKACPTVPSSGKFQKLLCSRVGGPRDLTLMEMQISTRANKNKSQRVTSFKIRKVQYNQSIKDPN